jgi:hypothetical protein
MTVLARYQGHPLRELTIVDRQLNARMKTFPTEIVTCRLDNETELRLFCKYEAGHNHNSYGHRGGIAYEAEVYHLILQHSPLSTPTFYGAYTDPITGDTWLILEYLHQKEWTNDGKAHIHVSDDFTRMKYKSKLGLAAEWIGQFHAANEAHVWNGSMSFLHHYDTEYYLAWARRTLSFASELQRFYPWLTTVCRHYNQIVDLLQDLPVTIIHGEYYKRNVVYLLGTAYPVDWESAVIAPGEIDLASLTERWPAEIAQHCTAAYQEVRWPEGVPQDLERRLDAARLYLQLRWLGERPEWTIDEAYQWRFVELHEVSERLGFI